MQELSAVTHGCPLSSVDALDVLGWPLDPGTPPFDWGRFKGWQVGFSSWLWAGAGLGWCGVIGWGSGWDHYVVSIEFGVVFDTDGHLIGPVCVGGPALHIKTDPPT